MIFLAAFFFMLNDIPGSYGVGRDNTNYKLYYLIFTNIFLQLKEKNKKKLEIRMIHAKHDLRATFGFFGG